MNQDTIIFLHIPKTGGQTLNAIVKEHFKPGTLFLNSEAVLSKLGKNSKKVSAFRRWELSKQTLANLSQSQKRQLKAIYGHMNFGFHSLLPQTCTYFTMFREPVERTISHYYYIMRKEGHHLNLEIKKNNLSISEFLESRTSLVVDNCQTRMISGIGASREYGKCTLDMLELARSNLKKHFSIIGLTEEFDKTLVLLKNHFALDVQPYQKKNVAPFRPSVNEVSVMDRKAIESYNQMDMQLYDYAKKLFYSQFKYLTTY